jgi:hypothetical protein
MSHLTGTADSTRTLTRDLTSPNAGSSSTSIRLDLTSPSSAIRTFRDSNASPNAAISGSKYDLTSAGFLRSESESSASRGSHGADLKRASPSMDMKSDLISSKKDLDAYMGSSSRHHHQFGARAIGLVDVDASGGHGDDGRDYGVGAGVFGDKHALSIPSSSHLSSSSLRTSAAGNTATDKDKEKEGSTSMYSHAASAHLAHSDTGSSLSSRAHTHTSTNSAVHNNSGGRGDFSVSVSGYAGDARMSAGYMDAGQLSSESVRARRGE